MKKVIAILIVLILLGSLFLFLKKEFPSTEKDSPKGEIKKMQNSAVDEDMYTELSSNIYRGTVNHKPLYFVFMKYLKEEGDQYQCLVFYDTDDKEEAYQSFSKYDAVINKDGMSLTYLTGPIETTFECEFKDGSLYVNGEKLKEADLSESPIEEI